MKHVTTYVGIDAHKKDLFMAVLAGNEATPLTWTSPNEPANEEATIDSPLAAIHRARVVNVAT